MARQDGVRRRSAAAVAGVSAIPDKLYFRIGEVSRICGVPSYVLRFWEREFPQLHPGKGGTGQRLYRRRDVEMVQRIRGLLYDDGYTIPGARQMLRGERVEDPTLQDGERSGAAAGVDRMGWIRTELREILEVLRGGARRPARMAGRAARGTVRHRGEQAMGSLFEPVEEPRTSEEEGDR